jgi:phosphoribosyl 1,2-cyclic phosphodiesterase
VNNILSLCSLGSGSSGNCYYIFNEDNGVLIDCGINTKQINRRFTQLGMPCPKIDAVFITHEHHDHVASCAILERYRMKESKVSTSFYMTNGTYFSANARCLPKNIQCISAGEKIVIGSLVVEAFAVPHDGVETVCYRVGSMGHWAGVITDLGHVTDEVLDKMRSLSLMVLEFNHDELMLINGDYNEALKGRILSDYGHLSNKQAAIALEKAVSPRLQHVLVAHVSDSNNRYELAKQAACIAIENTGHTDIVQLHIAEQHKPSSIYRVNQTKLNLSTQEQVLV